MVLFACINGSGIFDQNQWKWFDKKKNRVVKFSNIDFHAKQLEVWKLQSNPGHSTIFAHESCL